MKKKLLLMFVIGVICTFALQSNVYANDVTCSALPNVAIDESIPQITSLILKIIWIVVPILLVILGSIDLIKGVIAQKEDEIKKGQQIFIKRLIAGILVFFVIAIVKLLISAVSNDENIMGCACYFLNGPNDSSCNG